MILLIAMVFYLGIPSCNKYDRLASLFGYTIFPLVIFLVTNITAMNIQDLKSKHDLKLKFIEVVKPLYIEGSLKKEPELEQFYMKLLNLCESDRN